MEGIELPKAFELDEADYEEVDYEEGILVIVEFDIAEYHRKYCSKAVKKNVRNYFISSHK